MLTRTQKQHIRSIRIFHCSHHQLNGGNNSDFIMEFPKFQELYHKITEEISKIKPYRSITLVPKLWNANCIVRIFYLKNCITNSGIYNLYGAMCFTYQNFCWKTDQDILFDAENCIVTVDGRKLFCNFVDFIVQIK